MCYQYPLTTSDYRCDVTSQFAGYEQALFQRVLVLHCNGIACHGMQVAYVGFTCMQFILRNRYILINNLIIRLHARLDGARRTRASPTISAITLTGCVTTSLPRDDSSAIFDIRGTAARDVYPRNNNQPASNTNPILPSPGFPRRRP